MQTDINNPSTWAKHRKKLCDDCYADCCTMPVEVRIADLIRMEVADTFESQEPLKKIAKRLKKEGIVEHFNNKSEIFTLVRMSNCDCLYLDTQTRKCKIYDKRPDTCRNHPKIGPRPGFCAYNKNT
ncbi:MAG: YkgJ family cysteine cluster protein [Desulfobacterales bacterium]|nr:YkgJ family cysteine cluster protein [Desulfobacterales bacterium]